MKDNCYIDGVSTWSVFGVWVTKGGYNNLLAFPELKDPPTNDWPEEDGIEVDLSSPVFSSRIVDVTFLASRNTEAVNDFLSFISKPGYRTLSIPSLNRSWQLRFAQHVDNKYNKTAVPFTLQFEEDVFVRPLPTESNPGVDITSSSYTLDGVSLDRYGIVVDKAKDEVLKSPTAKVNMSREIQTLDGRIYDADHLVLNSKEVAFKCRFKASSVDAFWNCYDKFFCDLTAPYERQLYVEYLGEEFPCFYKRCAGFKIITLSPMVMVEFEMFLVFTVFRINETDYVLASEAGDWIVLEDGETFIDMNVYGS